ncbi:unnamed protein product, partial [Cyprideis torosa]
MLLVVGLFFAIMMGLGFPVMLIIFGSLTDTISMNVLTAPLHIIKEVMWDRVQEYTMQLIAIGIAHTCNIFIMGVCLEVTAKRQADRIRRLFLEASLRQDMTWYDLRGIGSFASRVADYSAALQDSTFITRIRGGVEAITIAVLIALVFLAVGVGFWYGLEVYAEEGQNFTAGSFFVSFAAMIQAYFGIANISNFSGFLARASAAGGVVFETIARVPEIDPYSSSGIVLDNVQGSIRFRDVTFSYPSRPEVTALKNVTFNIRPAQKVAFVGASGSGKSTALQLIQRFYDPDKGTIELDGYSLKDINVRSLRSHIGIVSQEPVLFQLSVKENIRLARQDATDDEIVEAAKEANAHDFIMELPE